MITSPLPNSGEFRVRGSFRSEGLRSTLISLRDVVAMLSHNMGKIVICLVFKGTHLVGALLGIVAWPRASLTR